MAREVVVNGWLYGVDPEQANRVRFAQPFREPSRHDWFEVDAGAITDLTVKRRFGGQDALIIECGMTRFELSGRSPSAFQLWRVDSR